MLRTLLLVLAVSTPSFAQSLRPIDRYVDGLSLNEIRETGIVTPEEQIVWFNVLPGARPSAFANYIAETRSLPGYMEANFSGYLQALDALRLNKLVGGVSGSTGTTSLASSVSVPAVIGLGVEYGGILQQNEAGVVSLRANALGLARMAGGAPQFSYCAEIEVQNCGSLSRRLRQLSGSVAFRRTDTLTDEVGTPNDLFGDQFQMSSWGLRLDLTPSNNLDDPKYVNEWRSQMTELSANPAASELVLAISALYGSTATANIDWRTDTVEILSGTSEAQFVATLELRLNLLIDILAEEEGFEERVLAVQRAYENYFLVRDEAVRAAHTHKLSVEYTNSHPENEPSRSTVRFIYSHQPTQAPLLVTLNVGASFYNRRAEDANGTRLRDVQFAAQMDRRLPALGSIQNPVLTFGGYYQWMKADALLTIPAGKFAPGTAIELPNEASTLLGTKGHIAVAQAKLSLPLGDTLKVPLSVTWASRTEFIKENDVRGQVGLTLDLDNLFQ